MSGLSIQASLINSQLSSKPRLCQHALAVADANVNNAVLADSSRNNQQTNSITSSVLLGNSSSPSSSRSVSNRRKKKVSKDSSSSKRKRQTLPGVVDLTSNPTNQQTTDITPIDLTQDNTAAITTSPSKRQRRTISQKGVNNGDDETDDETDSDDTDDVNGSSCTCTPGSPNHPYCFSCSTHLQPIQLQSTDDISIGDQLDLFASEILILRDMCDAEMFKTKSGRAQLLASAIKTIPAPWYLAPLETNILVRLTEKLIDLQDQFARMGKPTTVRLGYHYTCSQNLPSIYEKGLMTRKDQKAAGTSATKLTGSYFSDGVYCASNPGAFPSYGDCGLVVAILMGKTSERIDRPQNDEQSPFVKAVDCVLGNKNLSIVLSECPPHKFLYKDEIVLKNSNQCLPLLTFDKSSLMSLNDAWEDEIWKYHGELQGVIDRYFNGSVPTPVQRVSQNTDDEVIREYSQCPVSDWEFENAYVYDAPDVLKIEDVLSFCHRMRSANTSNRCIICLDPIISKGKGIAVRTNKCYHHFHANCIRSKIGNDQSCPLCYAKLLDEPQGRCPSGTMAIQVLVGQHCAGFGQFDTIEIVYNIEAGLQKAYHPHPGVPYGGHLRRTAYLPKTKNGYNLLKRLQYAFVHGLTFDVGTSATTGKDDSLIWSSISHKTAMVGGIHAYPDSQYLSDCNSQLDALQVPKADQL